MGHWFQRNRILLFGKNMENNFKFQNINIGHQTIISEKIFSSSQVNAFQNSQGDSGMPNKLTSKKFARQHGLPGPLVPGAMSIAYISRHLNDTMPKTRIKKLDIIFRRSVKQETRILASAIIVDKYIFMDKEIIECDVFLKDLTLSPLVIGKATIEFP